MFDYPSSWLHPRLTTRVFSFSMRPVCQLFLLPLRPDRYFLYVPLAARPKALPTDLLSRAVGYGERTWESYANAKAGTFRALLYQYGQKLMARLPADEEMLRRLSCHADASPHGLAKEEERQVTIDTSGILAKAAQSGQLSMARDRLREAMRFHGRWRRINFLLLVPLTILTLAPFVKLVWIWTAFRAYCHHRAWKGAQWLEGRFGSGRVEWKARSDIDGHVEFEERDDCKVMTEKSMRQLEKVLGLDDLATFLLRARSGLSDR